MKLCIKIAKAAFRAFRPIAFALIFFLTGCDVPTGKCSYVKDDGTIVVVFDCGETGSGETGLDSDDTDTDDIDDTGDTETDTPIDADGDGFTADVDCDDGNAAINPDAVEICDSQDNDCDSLVDDDDSSIEGQSTWYADSDSDGYGDPDSTELACEAPTGYVANSTDCDDTDGDIHPYATESCSDTVDMNCDGSAGSEDLDGDGVIACEDCNDNPATGGSVMYDGAEEICDGYDNDCDMGVDVDATDALTWYADTDGDEYGDPDSTELACEEPTGYVADATDCDDTESSINPGGTEVCDGIDQDCDGVADEDLTFADYYVDSDGDGYGVGTASSECEDPGAGYSTESGDCDDTEATAFPGGTEVCDSDNIDEDCNGSADGEDAIGATIWHHDADGDGYGSADDTVTQCDAPSAEWITTSTVDCNDDDDSVNPGATESCNEIDDDCDGDVDESGATGETTWYSDSDSDGYGDIGISQDACEQPSKYVENSDDCDDSDASINPDGIEVCDGIDQDCDGTADSGLAFTDYYVDSDGDGYGDDSGVPSSECEDPGSGYSDTNDDCDDSDSGINPGAVDIASDGIDQDCDGTDATVTDSDRDGDPDSTDCNDTDATVYTGATETCDGVDEDCDGSIDEGISTTTYYVDSDGDGYGDSATGSAECSSPGTGYSTVGGDCDDDNADVSPAESESKYTVWDDDCSGYAFTGLALSSSVTGASENLIVDELDSTFADYTTGSWEMISVTLGATIADVTIGDTAYTNTLGGTYPGMPFLGTGGAASVEDECFVYPDLGVASGVDIAVGFLVDNNETIADGYRTYVGDSTDDTTWVNLGNTSFAASTDAQHLRTGTTGMSSPDLILCAGGVVDDDKVFITHVFVIER